MITVFLRGGLGNQMFQYAAGLNLAKKKRTQLFLDTTFLNDRFPRKEFTYRAFDLDIFTLSFSRVPSNKTDESAPRFTALSKISNAVPIPGVWLGIDLVFMKVLDVLGIRRVIKEEEHRFAQSTLPTEGNIVLYGRWQSEQYFADIADDIRKAFHFREKLSGEAAAIAQTIKDSNSVSMHVRRGDYVHFESMKKRVGDTDLPYYAKAVSYIADRVPSSHFFVFSDDSAWCRENMKIPFPVTYCDEKTAGPKNAFHLELMSLCKHNIITNSTFSWWGAWLNWNPKKIVIAPARWYIDSLEEEDVVPKGWIKLAA